MKKGCVTFCTLLIAFSFIQVCAYAQQPDVKANLKAMKPADFPTREIEFVTAYGAGGGMDITARILAKYVEKYIDSRVIVINKTGGGGLIGHVYLASEAKNDGYSVGILSPAYWQFALTQKKYAIEAIDPLAYITMEPPCWLVSTKSPLFKDKSMMEILDYTKKNPNKVKINITPGFSNEFTVKKVERATGAQFIKVPFQGGKDASIAFLGGHIDLCQLFYTEFVPLLEAGQVKVVGVASNERYGYFPEVKTFNELLGVDYIEKAAWRFVGVPKGVKADRLRYLEAAIDAALRDKNCIEDFSKMKLIVGKTLLNPAQVKKEIERLAEDDEIDFKNAGIIK